MGVPVMKEIKTAYNNLPIMISRQKHRIAFICMASLKSEVNKAVQNAATKTENIVFSKLPATLEEFKSLPLIIDYKPLK